ncbi:MAG: pyridoxamine 5'-phosphate oxidase family protein [bacterium]|nr:pyridoxamine 5'-phosphate oxidase family protein [bacterium]
MTTKTERSEKVIKMLGNHTTTMLVTHGKDGGLVSRPMTTQKPEFDGDVWFFVSSDADVIEEVEANGEVNIAYSIEDNYLSLSGMASMVDDDAKKKELWYPELEKWFNGEGPESSHVRLIKVSVDTARYWDTSQADSKKSKSNGSKKDKKDESPIDSGMVKY